MLPETGFGRTPLPPPQCRYQHPGDAVGPEPDDGGKLPGREVDLRFNDAEKTVRAANALVRGPAAIGYVRDMSSPFTRGSTDCRRCALVEGTVVPAYAGPHSDQATTRRRNGAAYERRPVMRRVNDVLNDGPDLLVPVMTAHPLLATPAIA